MRTGEGNESSPKFAWCVEMRAIHLRDVDHREILQNPRVIRFRQALNSLSRMVLIRV